MHTAPSEWMIKAFSAPRLRSYLAAAQDNVVIAERLYWWNIEVSGAFYGPLHCLELVLRNALDARLRSHLGQETWWDVAQLAPTGRRMVTEAADTCRRRGSGRVTADDVVAQLSFGFWTSLLTTRYDRSLWVPTLNRAFPYYRGRRGDLHDSLEAMRLLRNRIMHHEPIHHRDLAADHRKIYRLIGFVDPVAAMEATAFDRVPMVLSCRKAVCDGSRSPSF